jgi:hypothetical protein
MPYYFFDTDDGNTLFRDEVGLELADDQAARDQGSMAIGELAREFIPVARWLRRGAAGSSMLHG